MEDLSVKLSGSIVYYSMLPFIELDTMNILLIFLVLIFSIDARETFYRKYHWRMQEWVPQNMPPIYVLESYWEATKWLKQ